MKTEILPTIGEKLQSIKHDKQATADFIAKSNPSLVCAAPELLQVAKDYVLLCKLHGLEGAVLDSALAAIVKAEGNL